MAEVAEEKLQPFGRDGGKWMKHKVQIVCGGGVDNTLGRERYTVGKLLLRVYVLITRAYGNQSLAQPLRYTKRWTYEILHTTNSLSAD